MNDNKMHQKNMPISKPEDTPQWTYAERWQSYIEDARAGDTAATRILMRDCIRILRRKRPYIHCLLGSDDKVTKHVGKLNGRGYLPEPLCTFLLETLEAAISAPTKEVGKAMGMGNPPKDRRNERELREFINRYSSQVDGNYPATPEQHVDALRTVMKQMGIGQRTAERYWEIFKPGVQEFGLPSPKGYSEKEKIEEFDKILSRYKSQMSSPVDSNNITQAAAHEESLKEVASNTGVRLVSVKRYWKAFETALEEYGLLPIFGSRNRATFEDLVTFVSHYVSIMNPPIGDNGIVPEYGEEEILDKVMALMNGDPVSHYWDIIDNTIQDF